MEAPSFASRRPAATTLPNFSLPAPSGQEIPSMQPHPSGPQRGDRRSSDSPYPSAPLHAPLPPASMILTPPSGVTNDGLSPSPGVHTGSSHSSQPGYYGQIHSQWPPGNSAYTYSSSAPATQGHTSLVQPSYNTGRPLYSPSMAYGHHRSSQSPATGEGLPPPQSPFQHGDAHSFHTGMPGGASGHHSLPSQQASAAQLANPILSSQNPVTQAPPQPTPATATGDYRNPPFSPYPPTSTPGQPSFPSFAPHPSPTQPSPTTSAAAARSLSSLATGMAPPLGYGTSGPPRPGGAYQYHHPMSQVGPVMSNIGNPGGQMAMVSPMSGMGMAGYGPHAHHLPHHLYGAQHQPQQERPFKCDTCPQSFNRNHDLKRHKRIHLAVKPFPCSHCDKSFSRKDALKRHRLVKGCQDKTTATTEGGNGGTPPDRSDVMSDSTNESPKTATIKGEFK